MRLLRDARVYQNVDNYRQGRALVKEAQTVLNDMGRDLQIRAMRDVEGSVVQGSFYSHPIDLSIDNMVLFRMRSHLVTAYTAMLSFSLPVSIVGQDDTATKLLDIIGNGASGPLSSVEQMVKARVSRLDPTKGASEVFDLWTCLLGIIEAYCAANPSVDPTLPEALTGLKDHILRMFAPKQNLAGIVRLATIHSAKGLKATCVYIAQAELLPLKERVAKGGWNEHEERCVHFVAVTRATDIMVYLPSLERVTRTTFLSLFEKPNDMEDEIFGSQDTEATMPEPEPEPVPEPGASTEESANAAVADALRVMKLTSLPATKDDLQKVVKNLLKVAHPDRNFNSTASKEYTQSIVAARSVLLRAYE